MTAHLHMDEAGRLLIPEDLRRALGLRPGVDIRADVVGEELRLRPEAGATLVEHAGRLVIQTQEPVNALKDELDASREARNTDVLGAW